MKEFVSIDTDLQSMHFVSTRLLKYRINGVCVPQSQLARIRGTTNTSHKNLFELCHEAHYMWRGNKYLEPQ